MKEQGITLHKPQNHHQKQWRFSASRKLKKRKGFGKPCNVNVEEHEKDSLKRKAEFMVTAVADLTEYDVKLTKTFYASISEQEVLSPCASSSRKRSSDRLRGDSSSLTNLDEAARVTKQQRHDAASMKRLLEIEGKEAFLKRLEDYLANASPTMMLLHRMLLHCLTYWLGGVERTARN